MGCTRLALTTGWQSWWCKCWNLSSRWSRQVRSTYLTQCTPANSLRLSLTLRIWIWADLRGLPLFCWISRLIVATFSHSRFPLNSEFPLCRSLCTRFCSTLSGLSRLNLSVRIMEYLLHKGEIRWKLLSQVSPAIWLKLPSNSQLSNTSLSRTLIQLCKISESRWNIFVFLSFPLSLPKSKMTMPMRH